MPPPPSPLSFSINESSSAPHYPEECRHEIFNFFLEFPTWEEKLELANSFGPLAGNLSIVIEGLKNLSDMSFVSCQKDLFDLPLYYVGQ